MEFNILINEVKFILENKKGVKKKTNIEKNLYFYSYTINNDAISYSSVLNKLNKFLKFFPYEIDKEKYIKFMFYKNSRIYYLSLYFNNIDIKLIKKNNLIVISGPDGVGKTHYINLLKNELKLFDKLFFFGHHIDEYKKKITKIENIKRQKNIIFDYFKRFYFFKIIMVFYSEYLYLNNIKIIKSKNIKKIIILERFFYDRIVIFKLLNIFIINQLVLKIFSFLYPKPNLYICLNDNPENIYSRKKELTIENIKLYNKKLIILLKSKKINYELIELKNKKTIPLENIINVIISNNLFTLSKYIDNKFLK